MPNLESIPVFGPCPRCGNKGTQTGGITRDGYELQSYRGKFYCQICISELQDHETDSIRNRNEVAEERFRNAIGIKKL